MTFSYLEYRASKDQNSFDTGADDAVIESAKPENAERDADRETPNEPPLSKEEVAEVFGLSPEKLEKFVEQATHFEFDGSKIVARPV